MKTAFLSSTAKDLTKYRDAAYEAIEGLDDWHCVRMEDFGARDAMADELCPEKVAECDVFVGIVGHYYGSSPEGSDKSYTEQEYDAAIATEKPRLMFLAPEDFPLPACLIEPDERRAKQRAFRDRVNAERIRNTFTSPNDLGQQMVQAIRNWEWEPTKRPEAARIARNLFRGRVRVVDENLFQHSASEREINDYYEGDARLTWSVVAGGGIVERDQHAELFEQLVNPPKQTQMICLVGEPGAGKSSLAWQLMYELARQQDNPILHVLDNTDANIWYRLPDFWKRIQQPFYILIDDIFREEDVVHVLKEGLDRKLPLTILATSRANEYRGNERIHRSIKRVDLLEPSLAEKARVLSKLGKEWRKLPPQQRERLDMANQFLVLMMELTTGKGLTEVIRDTLKRLERQDGIVYRAYEYICYVGQYDISMPTSLLERLEEEGRFYRLLDNRRAAQGLIFPDEARPGNLQVGHPLRAEHAARLYGRDPRSVVGEMLGVVDVESWVERRFIAHLLRKMAWRATEPCLPDILKRNATVIEDIQREAAISEMIIWRTLYQNLGRKREANHCVDMALSKDPISGSDCNYLLALCRERGKEADALSKFRQWLERAPGDHHARSAYLGLVDRHAPEQVPQVIKEAAAWLAKHPQHSSVRVPYLDLVDRKGTDAQVAQAIKETAKWLAQHPEDNYTRVRYMGLVEHRGTDEQIAQVIEETNTWLSGHLLNWTVLAPYLSLVRLQGTLEQKAQAIRNTKPQLVHCPEGSTIPVLYRTLISQLAVDEYGVQLLDREYLEDARRGYEYIMAQGTQDRGVLYGYGCLLLGLEEFAEAAEQFCTLLKLHKAHTEARRRLAWALNGLGKFHQAEDEFKHALWWAEHVTDYPASILHHDLGVFYLDQERYTEARSKFEKTIEEYPERFTSYWHLGEVLMAQGDYRNAADALQTALDKAPQDLLPTVSEEIDALLEEAEWVLEWRGGK